MSDHAVASSERSARRRSDADMRVARAAVHQHGRYASARLGVQARAALDRAAQRMALGLPGDADVQRAERLNRARMLIESGEVTAPGRGERRDALARRRCPDCRAGEPCWQHGGPTCRWCGGPPDHGDDCVEAGR